MTARTTQTAKPPQPRAPARRWLLRILPALLAAAAVIAVVLVAIAAVAYARTDVPAPGELATAQVTMVTYRDGEALGRFQSQNRVNVELADVPEHVRNAVLSAEDRSFYSNLGISPTGIVRALWNNARGRDTQGASTITQQYAKTALTQDTEQTYARKVREAFLAVKLNRETEKDQLLEDYLNTVYFGRGAYGVQTASQAYFGKEVGELTVAEGATLAALIQQPARFEQPEFRGQLQARWTYTLDGMVAEGWLPAEDREGMAFPEFIDKPEVNRLAGPTGYLLANVQRELTDRGFSEADIDAGGLTVATTYDANAQAAAVAAVESQAPTRNADGLRVGLTALTPGTGAVLASYGGPDYLADQFDNATQGRAQPGSTFKPFALTAALEEGISLRSRFNGNTGLRFTEYDSGRPVPNFANSSFGQIDLVKATANSVNTVYVALGIKVGAQSVLDAAVRAGIPADTPALDPFPSIVLGVADTRVVDLAEAYATFAAQGVQADPYVVESVTDPDGTLLYQADPRPERVFAEAVMADATYAMTQVVRSGSGSRARALGRPVAGKTGTTNEGNSAWFAGYTPQIAAVVGLYRFDENRQPISLDGIGGGGGVTGGNYPARIWTAFMQGALEGLPVEEFPDRANVGRAFNPAAPATRSPSPSPSASPSETAEPSEDASQSGEPSPGPSAEPPLEPPQQESQDAGQGRSPEPTGRSPEPTEGQGAVPGPSAEPNENTTEPSR